MSRIPVIAFFMILFSITLMPYLTQDAFATFSPLTSAIANDPDDGDAIYSVGDTIVITFPVAVNGTFASGTMDNDEFRANFTFSASDIDDNDIVSGVWNSAATALTITIDTIIGTIAPVINTETISYDVTNGNIGYGTNSTEFAGGAVTLTGDFGIIAVTTSSGSNNYGCWGDCTSPTIGLDKYEKRMVDGGFSYNGNAVDAIAFHTPFPLITAQIGQTNTVTVKIYDEYGTQGVKLVQFALGLPEIGAPLDNAEAIIGIWLESGGINVEKVSITDKRNLIENSSVKTQTEIVDCREGSADQCILVTMKYKYREASIYNVMRVNVMDNYRNLQTSTFNDGVEVLGESMNPADTMNIIPVTLQQYPQKRGLVELIQIDRSEKLWTDPYGYIWQGDESKMVLLSIILPKEQDNDPKSVWSGYNDRINSNFVMYKQEQIVKAQEIFDEIVLYIDIQEDDLSNYVAETMNYGTVRDRANDSVLQQALIDEANRAELVLEEILNYSELVMR